MATGSEAQWKECRQQEQQSSMAAKATNAGRGSRGLTRSTGLGWTAVQRLSSPQAESLLCQSLAHHIDHNGLTLPGALVDPQEDGGPLSQHID